MKKQSFVGIIFVNSERKVLLQLRNKNENLYPNHWTLPGGKVEEDESPEQAIVREVKEELDLNLHKYELFKVFTEKTPARIVERIIYWCKISERTDDLKLGEGVALRYFSSSEIPSLKIAFDLRAVIEEWYNVIEPKTSGDVFDIGVPDSFELRSASYKFEADFGSHFHFDAQVYH